MARGKTVVGNKGIDDAIGPALKESGIAFKPIERWEEAMESQADCFLVDAREADWTKNLSKLNSKNNAPILSIVKSGVHKEDLKKLHDSGATGYVREGTPVEEVVIRLRAMLEDQSESHQKESRAAHRVWFQQLVTFKAFDREHTAWSTTLSETGIFLRTPLTLPLYSVIRMKFEIIGSSKIFEADGVIVRQEVEGPIRGIGVMFQNLTGENIILLESFLQLHP